MKSRLLLNVVVRKSTAVLELLSSKDKTLLVGRDTFLVLNLSLDVVDCVRRFDLKRDGLAGQRLNKDLHTTAETKNEVERALLLDVVVGEGATVLELLAGEDQTLLVGRDALLVLNLRLDIVDGIGRLDLERDRLAREGLNEDLHTATETEHEVEGGLLLNVVVRKSAAVFKLLAREDQALLVGRDAAASRSTRSSPLRFEISRYLPLLVLDLGLDIVDGVRGLNLESDGFTREAPDNDQHFAFSVENNEMHSRLDENLHDCRRSCLSNELNDGVVDKSD